MKKLLILVAIAACCVALPANLSKDDTQSIQPLSAIASLQRPSPINPEVPSDPKPAERILGLTDAKELPKYKRETDQTETGSASAHLTPSILPSYPQEETHQHDHHHEAADNAQQQQQHHSHDALEDEHEHQQHQYQHQHERQKRHDETKAKDTVKDKVELSKNPSATTSASVKPVEPTPPKRTYKARSTIAPSSTSSAPQQQRRQRRDDGSASPSASPLPLIYRDQHIQPHAANSDAAQVVTPLTDDGFVRPQTLPALLPAEHEQQHALQADSQASHVDAKRDIPVPLIAKHQHPEESPKEDLAASEQHKVTTDIDANNQHKDAQKEHFIGQVPPTHHEHHHSQEQQHEIHHSQEQQHEIHPSTQQTHEEHKQESPDHHKSGEHTASSTDHPVIRRHPVPVAELFGRVKPQGEN